MPLNDDTIINNMIIQTVHSQTNLDATGQSDGELSSFSSSQEDTPLSSLFEATATRLPLAPIGNIGPVRRGRSHQANRLRKNRQNNRDQAPSRKANMAQGRLTKAVNSAVKVQVELHDLGPSSTSKHGDRVHQYEELEGLGIRTIKWDGRCVFSSILDFHGLMLLGHAGIPFQ